MTSTAQTQGPSKTAAALAAEMKQEAATTRRVLERIPNDKMTWKPHEKSMTLGQLANHIAMVPGSISGLAQVDEFDASAVDFTPPMPKDTAEALATLEAGVAAAEAYISGLSEAALDAPWRMTAGGKVVMSISRHQLLRAILFNHWYHHRGQLSVYLRMLDVPIPSIYGPSADENPFR